MTQSARTKGKIVENLGLIKQLLEKKYGQPVDDETMMVFYNALSWTADDVEDQLMKEWDTSAGFD